jgi:transposase-like protein
MRYSCPRCSLNKLSEGQSPIFSRAGRFYRKSDGHWVSRYLCGRCGHRFSAATFNVCYRQKKRHLNFQIAKELTSGVSQRKTSKNVCVSRKTVARKLQFLGAQARKKMAEYLDSIKLVTELEFDDMETFEETKCKPLSIPLAVEAKTRRILGFEVASMPANGLLAKKALKKYGPRKDQRGVARRRLFERIRPLIHPNAIIRSDQNPHYPTVVKEFFPSCTHQTVKGRKPASTGQGELKKVAFDPIFSLNHTCAMLRYQICSLIRKTWCTTKKADRLADRIAIYAHFHNLSLKAS